MAFIDLEYTFNSGQIFLWSKLDKYWFCVNGQDIYKIDVKANLHTLSGNKYDFFRNKDNHKEIISQLSEDVTIRKAIAKFNGLRILRQDPFQCLITFITSSNSNLQKIRFCLEKMCKNFGQRVEFDKKNHHLFPTCNALASASIEELKKCGLGYRAQFIKAASKMVLDKKIDLDELKIVSYEEAKTSLLKLPGVGNKVADCIMLFSLDKLESFPLDRWMLRSLHNDYDFVIPTKTLTDKQYDLLHQRLVERFGQYAGYAQQYLFRLERDKSQKKWL